MCTPDRAHVLQVLEAYDQGQLKPLRVLSARLTTGATEEAEAIMAVSNNRLTEVEALIVKAKLAGLLSRDDVVNLTLKRHEA
ncbi:hypothetical protein BH24DEI2_BH24DEI2_10570 [soil metagenome]